MSTRSSAAAPRIRPAKARDEPAVLALAVRLGESGALPDRSAEVIAAAERDTLHAAFRSLPEGAALLVAEGGAGRTLGFVFLQTRVDYFSGAPHGHVGILAVAEEAQGQGVGHALLRAGEVWAVAQGYGHLTITVFEENARARALYERFGFRSDMITYRKALSPSPRRGSADAS
jgi:ribosomal protein S18 acetylase RimI-like enzyme